MNIKSSEIKTKSFFIKRKTSKKKMKTDTKHNQKRSIPFEYAP